MGNELEFIKNFTKILDVASLEVITLRLNEAFYHLERNANSKILFLDLSLQIMETFHKSKHQAHLQEV